MNLHFYPQANHCNEAFEKTDWLVKPKKLEAWLGEPVAIKPPTTARFTRQSGRNMLVVTRDEEEGVGILAATMVSLFSQIHPKESKFYVMNAATAETSWFNLPEQIAESFSHPFGLMTRQSLLSTFSDLLLVTKKRLDGDRLEQPSIFVVLIGIHRIRDLRLDEGASRPFLKAGEVRQPTLQEAFATLLKEGPEVGIHFLIWCENYAGLLRVLDRKSLSEIGMRVVGQMSSDDSNKD